MNEILVHPRRTKFKDLMSEFYLVLIHSVFSGFRRCAINPATWVLRLTVSIYTHAIMAWHEIKKFMVKSVHKLRQSRLIYIKMKTNQTETIPPLCVIVTKAVPAWSTDWVVMRRSVLCIAAAWRCRKLWLGMLNWFNNRSALQVTNKGQQRS